MRSMATWCFGGVLALVGGGLERTAAALDLEDILGDSGGPSDPVNVVMATALECLQDKEGDCAKALCGDDAQPIDFCVLADRELASLALTADPQTTRGLLIQARRRLSKEQLDKIGARLGEPTAGDDSRKATGAFGGLGSTLPSPVESVTGLAGRTVEQQVALAAAGLARLIQDRAKQESAAWALDTVGEKICDADAQQSLLEDLPEPDQTEIRDELLRSFCGLALSDRLGGYGAGEETLQLLQDAVNDDVRDLPGAISGKVLLEAVDQGYEATDPYADSKAIELAAARSEGARVLGLYESMELHLATVEAWSQLSVQNPTNDQAEQLAAGSGAPTDLQKAANQELTTNKTAWSGVRTELEAEVLSRKVIVEVAALDAAATDLCMKTGDRCWTETPAIPSDAEARLVAALQQVSAWSSKATTASDALAICTSAEPLASECLSKMKPLERRWRSWDSAMGLLAELPADAKVPGDGSEFQKELSKAISAVGSAFQFADPSVDRLSDALRSAAGSLDGDRFKALVAAILAARAHSDAYLAAHRIDDLYAQTALVLTTPLRAYEADTLREDWRVDVRRIVDGTDPLFAMGQMANDLDRWNRRAVGVSGVLKFPEAEVASCALSLPEALRGAQTQLGAKQLGPSSFAAALTASQSCWTIFGEGRLITGLGELDPHQDNSYLAIDEPSLSGRLERLSTAFRLYAQLATPGTTLAARWQHMQDLEKRIQEATKEFDAQSAALIASLQEKGLGKQDIEALREALRQQTEGARQLLLMQVELAETALDIGQIVLDTTRDAPDQLRGLCTYRDALNRCVNVIQAPDLSKADAALDGFREALGAMRDVLGGQPVRALLDGVRQLNINCKDARDEDKCIQARDQLTAWFGALAALSDAEDADAAARALDAVVNPPGGWRIKQDPHSFTLSVGSHAGFMGGYERRWGTYGLVRERGEDVYPVAPTLALPVGLDFSWACTKHRWNGGFFVSLLDPAAFLQYDVQEGGALPDPNLMTVLAPGLAGRIGIPTTPFGILAGGVYRPNLRSVSEPGFASTGANAMQVYVAATVDVTLWSLYRQHLKGGE